MLWRSFLTRLGPWGQQLKTARPIAQLHRVHNQSFAPAVCESETVVHGSGSSRNLLSQYLTGDRDGTQVHNGAGLSQSFTRHNHHNRLIFPPFRCTSSGPRTYRGIATMSKGSDSKSGKDGMLALVPSRIRNFGQHLRAPNFKRRSRSLSPSPSSSSSGKTSPAVAIAPGAQLLSVTNTPSAAGPSAPSHASTGSTTADHNGTRPATPLTVSTATGHPATTLSISTQTSPTATALPHTLSPLEIRQRTAELLEGRLTAEEVKKIKWEETAPEQAKAVVQEVKRSLEGKPEHSEKMYKTLQYINKYSTIIDVAIQHQPCITALVWAGMRTVIQVGAQPPFLNSCLPAW